jgi:hypothetical protein
MVSQGRAVGSRCDHATQQATLPQIRPSVQHLAQAKLGGIDHVLTLDQRTWTSPYAPNPEVHRHLHAHSDRSTAYAGWPKPRSLQVQLRLAAQAGMRALENPHRSLLGAPRSVNHRNEAHVPLNAIPAQVLGVPWDWPRYDARLHGESARVFHYRITCLRRSGNNAASLAPPQSPQGGIHLGQPVALKIDAYLECLMERGDSS